MDGAPLYSNVANYLDVQIPGRHRRADAGVRADVTGAFRSDPLVPSRPEVERSIRSTLGADAAATDIAVTTSPGTVTLSGTVPSWTQRHAAVAVAAAAAVGGVRTVHDHLTVSRWWPSRPATRASRPPARRDASGS
jgi:hypothetical protein